MGRLMTAGPVARGLALALLVLSLLAALAAPASAAVLWTLTVTPLTATQGQATTFTVTATNLNLLDDLGCVQVDLPPSFSIVSTTAPQASGGEDWLLSRNGQAIVVQADDGGDRLELGQAVQFTVRASPQQAGVFTWANHGHGDQDCGDGEMIGVPVAVTVLPGAATPTPQPTAAATLSPTPKPTLIPTLPPLPTLPPVPLPTLRPTATPIAAASPRPGPSTPPSEAPAAEPTGPASPSQDGSPADAAPTRGPGDGAPGIGSGSGPRAGSGLTLRAPDEAPGATGSLRVAPFSLLTGIGAWVVPAAVIGGSGLLVVLFVILQVVGAAVWLPAVRRLRGEARASG